MDGIWFPFHGDVRIRPRITADGQLSLAEPVKVRLEIWPQWLLTACDSAGEAAEHQAAAVKSLREGADAHFVDESTNEWKASIASISACAFALEAFYASVTTRLGRAPSADRWRVNRTARHKQILETIRYHFKLSPKVTPVCGAYLGRLFALRDRVVHPPLDFREPVPREDYGRYVDPSFVEFSAQQASVHVTETLSMLVLVLDNQGRVSRELGDKEEIERWLGSSAESLRNARERASRYGVTSREPKTPP